MIQWDQRLVDSYPNFFDIEVDGKISRPGRPTCASGWADLLERALGRISAAIANEPEAQFKITRIKEKFGTLRLYFEAPELSATARTEVDEAIALAEARSACTCEVCGNEGRLYKTDRWVLTVCERHAEGEPVPIEAGSANVRTEWAARNGKLLACARRYDRANDRFIAIEPDKLDLED